MSKKYYIVKCKGHYYTDYELFSDEEAKKYNFILVAHNKNEKHWSADLYYHLCEQIAAFAYGIAKVFNQLDLPDDVILTDIYVSCNRCFANNPLLNTPNKLSMAQVTYIYDCIERHINEVRSSNSYKAFEPAQSRECVCELLNFFSSINYKIESINNYCSCICPVDIPIDKLVGIKSLITEAGCFAQFSKIAFEESELPPIGEDRVWEGSFAPIGFNDKKLKQYFYPGINPNDIEVIDLMNYDILRTNAN